MEIPLYLLAAAAVAVILIFVFLHVNKNKHAKQNKKYYEFEKRREAAFWATARVADIRGGAAGETSEKTRMRLALEVSPPGGETYLAHADWLIELPELSSFIQGSEIQVKIDAADPGIIYPGSEHALYIPG